MRQTHFRILLSLALCCLTASLPADEPSAAFTPDPTHFIVPLIGWTVDGFVLLIFGFIAQALFFARMASQVWASARQKSSVVPPEFWYLSAFAGAMLAVYFFVRSDPVGMLLQIVMLALYIRNIYLLHRLKLPKTIRRRISRIVAFGLVGCAIFFLAGIAIEGHRQVVNQPDPEYFLFPGSETRIPVAPVLALGFLGAAVFSGRFFIQWLASERAQQSVVPPAFWYMALGGSLMLLLYFILRSDPIGVLGQLTGAPAYCYNIFLLRNHSQKS